MKVEGLLRVKKYINFFVVPLFLPSIFLIATVPNAQNNTELIKSLGLFMVFYYLSVLICWGLSKMELEQELKTENIKSDIVLTMSLLILGYSLIGVSFLAKII